MTVHRLRDLDRTGRVVAASFGAALSLAPLLALGRYLPDWFPSGDPAWMGLQTLEVGTRHTPLIGQQSLSEDYVADQVVHHLGATHFYLMAPFVRTLGLSPGMLLVSVLITGGCLLVAAWTVFRHFGPVVGAGAALVLGLVSFTTGASSLVNPVSSNIAGYPFLCSMFLLLGLLLGDLRLLPLTAAVVSFTALQHLSVLPSLAVATALATAGGGLRLWWGGERPTRRELGRWLAITAGVGFVLWLPVLLQNTFGNEPNLNALVEFTRSSDRPKLGYSTAVRHVAHVLGLPPVLGRTDLAGEWLFTPVSLATGLTAGTVLVVVGFAVWHWGRARSPRLAVAVMALVVAVAGLVGSATVPEGHEQTRLVFYHWIFPLAALVALVGGLLVAELLTHLGARPPRAWFVAAALVVVVAIGVANPFLDRWTNSLQAAYAPFERAVIDEFADEVADRQDEFDDDTVLVAGRSASNTGMDPALLLQLRVRGVDLDHAHAEDLRPGGELASEWSRLDTGLVLVLDTDVPGTGRPAPPRGGELIAEQELPDGIVLRANIHRDLSRDQPATLELYLVDREELRSWLTTAAG